MTRAEARARGALRYVTNRACRRGHVAERYVSNADCVVCAQRRREAIERVVRERTPAHRPHPRAVTTDFSYLTETQVEAWYAKVRAMKPNSARYKHHPLAEMTILWKPPLRFKETS